MAGKTAERKHADEVKSFKHVIFQLKRIVETQDTFKKIEVLNHNIVFNLMLKELDEIFFDLDIDTNNKFKEVIENYKENIKKLEGDFDKNTLSFREININVR